MPALPARPLRPLLAALALTALGACSSSFSGPVEVTRFVAERPVGLGEGRITLEFPEEMSNARAREAFAEAVSAELGALGYDVVMTRGSSTHLATIRTSRNPIAEAQRRGPVSVGVGGGTGGFGSGVGVGVGLDLVGGRDGPTALTELSVRISDADGESLWEGRAQQAVSAKSAYADVDVSAQTLAAALFRDFPGGNGETVIVELDEIQEPE
ncbi:hypothetical protein [Erythrobacter sp.]|jgi:hypothetical protein|uniref:hypothetical protein n=1 Tax=Erythrobacter sp. TaxID=1042 RepID=UPI002EB64563|nr:hypothetical protein [Erythrobacter sp.]